MTHKLSRLTDRYGASILVIFMVVLAWFVIFYVNRLNPPQTYPSNFSLKAASSLDWSVTAGLPSEPGNANFFQAANKNGTCLITIFHRKGAINVATKVKQNEASFVKDGYSIKQVDTKTLTLKTATGPRQYELHQYHVTGDGIGWKMNPGQEFGYIPLSKGYLDVRGYCDSVEQLQATIPALRAIKFNPTD